MKLSLAAAAALLCLAQAGCLFKKAPAASATPPPPPPKIQMPPPPVPTAKPLEEPQLPPPQKPVPEEEPRVIRPQLEHLPPRPKPQPRRRAPAPQPAPAAPEPPPAKPLEPKVEPKKEPVLLGEVLSDDVRRTLQATVEENLNTARRALAGLQGRLLTHEQEESAGRIRAFIRQCEETRAADLRAAEQFSRRAALLSKDLLDSLR